METKLLYRNLGLAKGNGETVAVLKITMVI